MGEFIFPQGLGWEAWCIWPMLGYRFPGELLCSSCVSFPGASAARLSVLGSSWGVLGLLLLGPTGGCSWCLPASYIQGHAQIHPLYFFPLFKNPPENELCDTVCVHGIFYFIIGLGWSWKFETLVHGPSAPDLRTPDLWWAERPSCPCTGHGNKLITLSQNEEKSKLCPSMFWPLVGSSGRARGEKKIDQGVFKLD